MSGTGGKMVNMTVTETVTIARTVVAFTHIVSRAVTIPVQITVTPLALNLLIYL